MPSATQSLIKSIVKLDTSVLLGKLRSEGWTFEARQANSSICDNSFSVCVCVCVCGTGI
jgi:hypothetical protein